MAWLLPILPVLGLIAMAMSVSYLLPLTVALWLSGHATGMSVAVISGDLAHIGPKFGDALPRFAYVEFDLEAIHLVLEVGVPVPPGVDLGRLRGPRLPVHATTRFRVFRRRRPDAVR